MTKLGNNYTLQSLNSQNHVFIGYNESTGAIGRAYLQFDIRSIPANATITSVYVTMDTYDAPYPTNYNGNIVFHNLGSAIYSASSTNWEQLKTGNPLFEFDMGIYGTEKSTYNFDSFLDAIKYAHSNGSYNFYLSINHKQEDYRSINLNGAQKYLYLQVGYTIPRSSSIVSEGDVLTEVYNLSGQKVLNIKTDSAYRIQDSDLPDGIYVIKITNEDGITTTEKISLNR